MKRKLRLRKSALSTKSAEMATPKLKALRVLSRMRREKLSLAQASRLEHVKPKTVRTHVGSALIQDRPGGRFRATAGDTFQRPLRVTTALGEITVPVRGTKAASRLARYQNAVADYLRTGRVSKLNAFKGKSIKVRGQQIEFVTDPETLTGLANAGALQFDQLYGSIGGAQ